jgi:hypothetical protein
MDSVQNCGSYRTTCPNILMVRVNSAMVRIQSAVEGRAQRKLLCIVLTVRSHAKKIWTPENYT